MKFLQIIPLILFISVKANAQLYVSPSGNDDNTGTKEQPFATLQKAIKHARELRRIKTDSVTNDIHIILKGGTYFLDQTINIRPEDGGNQQSSTFIEAAENEKPILSGGIKIQNWKKLSSPVIGLSKQVITKIWVADVPQVNGNEVNFRQLWVNDTKAVRAKDTKGELMNRIISWNKKEQTCMIPTPKFNLQNSSGAEMFIHQWWSIANLRIKKVQVMGDSTKLLFHQPESKIQSEHPWPAPWINKETGNSAFYLTNAIQFLDEPGEWYLDKKNNKLFYYPLPNENIATATIIAPYLETLINVKGTLDNPVSHLVISGISFQHCGWLRPSVQGHVSHQAGMYMTEAYKLKPAGTKEKPSLDNQAWIDRQHAAIEISYAKKTRIKNCSFQHLAASGIDLIKGVQDNMSKNNLFSDVGGSAIVIGNFGDDGREIHLPFNPKDERESCDNILIENNFITNATNEDWSCAGIGCGFVSNTTIQHNEIENVSNSAISLGWGWTPQQNMMKNNKIFANKISLFGKHNYDCGGIYTLSNLGNSVVENNYIDSIYKAPYAHLPQHWFYLYTDEGSSNLTVKNNWTPSNKYLQNQNGNNCIWQNNGNEVEGSIKLNAGLQSDFSYLLKYKSGKDTNYDINENTPIAIELMANEIIDTSKLYQILQKSKVEKDKLYNWQNHYVIFDYVQDAFVLQERLKNAFPKSTVKTYYDVVYNYQKQKNCTNKTSAKEWNHILLTANLVKDEKLQQEYIDYHKTQFEKWPEVSQGFCNAGFQQLLVMKNGRQLMLVISIPKGESLDKINPKTIENNPRMNDWNKIMGKYQEGIEGTRKGETWVFLKQLHQQ